MAGSARIKAEGYHGSLVINGTAYDHDVIIHADGSLTGRNCGCTPELRVQMCQTYSQDYFHAPLAEWELDFLAEERPEVIINRRRVQEHAAHNSESEGDPGRVPYGGSVNAESDGAGQRRASQVRGGAALDLLGPTHLSLLLR